MNKETETVIVEQSKLADAIAAANGIVTAAIQIAVVVGVIGFAIAARQNLPGPRVTADNVVLRDGANVTALQQTLANIGLRMMPQASMDYYVVRVTAVNFGDEVVRFVGLPWVGYIRM